MLLSSEISAECEAFVFSWLNMNHASPGAGGALPLAVRGFLTRAELFPLAAFLRFSLPIPLHHLGPP